MTEVSTESAKPRAPANSRPALRCERRAPELLCVSRATDLGDDVGLHVAFLSLSIEFTY
jgi:hypothetical protein